MRNAGLEEAQAGIKFAGRNISNLRYTDGMTLMAESKEELKSLLMKEKSEKAGLALSAIFLCWMVHMNVLADALKSLLQYHSSKASILWYSAFFIVQLLYPYMTTGKTIVLTRQTFVDKVMSLLLNMLSRLVITLLPRSKHLLISWLKSPSAVILEPPKNEICHHFHCFPHLFAMK